MRSLLFVPGDSERKQAKALATAADALILDLEDSVDVTQLPAARARVHEFLRSNPDRARQQLWVRVNALSSGLLLEDLAAVMADTGEGGPDGIVLPKVSHPGELEEVAHYLAAFEVRGTRSLGSTRLMAIATETPRGLLSLPNYPQKVAATPAIARRLIALTWGAEDLGAALGVTARVDSNGAPTLAFQMARSSCLVTAAALGVQAIDSVHIDFRNREGLARELGSARRDGFTGKLAIHPDQIDAINAALIPTEVEVAKARRIVAAF
ncbi:MAG: HpcH/HpaI aldolase/citrate lyase family protein, partial [Steroidobacteraceae bacterium]